MLKQLKNFTCLIFIIVLVTTSLDAQVIQTLRGKVVDARSGKPLAHATVVVLDTDPLKGTVTDSTGSFLIRNVPGGRVSIKASYMGYKTRILEGLYVSSGKQMEVTIQLEEKVFETGQVVVQANQKSKPVNRMALVSSRSFTIEETEKFAGSLGDPARMAANYAGVKQASDQVNDIIIRGNSPNGLLWLLEGLRIPNPNHFGSMGSTGGPISMLNNNVLRQSDFFTGAFPPQYGNALSGVFDLHLRSGNKSTGEYLAQVGFNGLEVGLEGPMQQGKSSYLLNYRYSTLKFIEKMGFNLDAIAIPQYHDLNFHVSFPSTKLGDFSWFGLGGMNRIGNTNTEKTLEKQFSFDSKMGVSGISHTWRAKGASSSLKTTLGISYHNTSASDHEYTRNNRHAPWDTLDWHGYENMEKKWMLTTQYRNKMNPRNILMVGASVDYIRFRYLDSLFMPEYEQFFFDQETKNDMYLFQSYVQWNHLFNDALEMVGGVHFQKVDFNKELSIEPRFAVKWDIAQKHSAHFGYGLHSQMQPRFVYFKQFLTDTLTKTYRSKNRDLEFSKSHHWVAGYEYAFAPLNHLKIEAYYQYLYDVPVEMKPSYISMINYGSSFYTLDYDTELVNKGVGENYGIELTLEQFFKQHFYYLATVSLFESKYKASDGKWRNTMYNGNFVLNLLGGYEYTLRNQNTLAVNARTTWSGGNRKLPIDLDESIEQSQTVYDTQHAFEKKYPDYFRVDVRFSYRINRPDLSHMLAFSLINLTDRQNHFMEMYNKSKHKIEEFYQIGLTPILSYRLKF